MYEISEKDIKYCDWLTYRFCKKWGKKVNEDIIQKARLAMVISAHKYDESFGVKFMSYARSAMKNKLVRHFYNNPLYRHVPNNPDIMECSIRVTKKNCEWRGVNSAGDDWGFFEELRNNKFYSQFYKIDGEYSSFKDIDVSGLVAQRDIIRKCFERMPVYMQDALIKKYYHGIDIEDTTKEYGFKPRVISELFYIWRKKWIEGKPIYKKRLRRDGKNKSKTEMALGDI